ncbi:arabinofuranosyltransferase [Actinoplanes sp. NPDC051513]|uniref:arabinofuranosyltransferase n=1 Tax=Actinoplanes sp. NPDC051513 TaxID=3363908 RepID=UPI0037892FD0
MERLLDPPNGQSPQYGEFASGGESPEQKPDKSAPERDNSTTGNPLQRIYPAIRPWLFAAAVGLVVLLVYWAADAANFNPYSGRTQYGLRTAPIIVAALAGGAVWWARRRGQTWDSDLLPALFGGLASLTVLVALHGTPFDIYGLNGDQTFRQELVTRFADTWHLDDYMYRGLPAYYAPTYFWVLGRAAAITGAEPWHMMKYGTIAVAFLMPILSYLLWRRIVTPRVAALIAAASLIIPWISEPYAAIVVVTFLPWWLQVGHGLTRKGLRPTHPVVLGLIGAVLFTEYYYFFFLVPFVFVLQYFEGRRRGAYNWRETGRTALIFGIAALGSAVYWAPLLWNMLTAPNVESLNNRWISLGSGLLALPMLEPSVFGALCLIGLVFLVVTAKEALSRAMLIILVALYVWQVAGFPFMVVDKPLMSFRMRELVPVLLLAGAAMAVVRASKYAVNHISRDVVWRLAATGGLFLAIFAGDRFISAVLTDAHYAHDQTLPNGKLPPYHTPSAVVFKAPPEPLTKVIDAQYRGEGHAVVLTDRNDVMALYPYYGFVQYNVNYSHPTSQFHPRLDFLRDLATAAGPQDFADRTATNPYDKIDAIVLSYKDKNTLRFRFRDDDFPFGSNWHEIFIPRKLIQPQYFQITEVNGVMVAVRRPPA